MNLENINGITVKELKEYVNKLTEVNPLTGEDCEVWLEVGDQLSSPVKNITALNYRTHKDIVFFDICLSGG